MLTSPDRFTGLVDERCGPRWTLEGRSDLRAALTLREVVEEIFSVEFDNFARFLVAQTYFGSAMNPLAR